jgi:hypothetical protein
MAVAWESVLFLARSQRRGPPTQSRQEIFCRGNGKGDEIPPSFGKGFARRFLGRWHGDGAEQGWVRQLGFRLSWP